MAVLLVLGLATTWACHLGFLWETLLVQKKETLLVAPLALGWARRWVPPLGNPKGNRSGLHLAQWSESRWEPRSGKMLAHPRERQSDPWWGLCLADLWVPGSANPWGPSLADLWDRRWERLLATRWELGWANLLETESENWLDLRMAPRSGPEWDCRRERQWGSCLGWKWGLLLADPTESQ